MTFLKCWASTVRPRKDVPSAHLFGMFNFPPQASIQVYPSCREAVLFTHMLAVEKFFSDSLYGLFHVNWSHMEDSTAVHSQEETLGAVVTIIYGTSLFAHDVLIKLVSVR